MTPPIPYKGLTPYSERDAPFFFGRETECEVIIANLIGSRLTVLYGASGVGKSSILQAGVLNRIREESAGGGEGQDGPEFLAVLFNQWSSEPVAGLQEQVREAALEAISGRAAELEDGSASLTLADTLSRWTTRLNLDLLIILDQFEEYFLYHGDEAGAGTFDAEFPRALSDPALRANFLIAIREDALARLDRFKGRASLFENTLRIQHLGRDAARAAIEEPLKAYNQRVPEAQQVRADPELVEDVLDGVRVGQALLGESGRGETRTGLEELSRDPQIEAPYLQLVMTELWAEERRQGSRVLRADTLRALGGAQRIVRTHLDQAMAALSGHEQQLAAGVFRYLVTPSGSKISHTERDLADYAGFDPAEVGPVLQKLSTAEVRILRPVATPFGASEELRYEIFHDVLAPAILDWRARYLQQRAAEARVAERLEREAAEKRAAEEQARIYHRRAQRRGALVIGMVLLLMFTVAMAAIAVYGANSARKGQIAAQASEAKAHATAQLTVDPAASVQSAARAVRLEPSTPGGELVLRQALAESHVRVVMRGHGDAVTSAVFSHDGRSILTASSDRTARLWSPDTGAQLAAVPLASPSNLLAPAQFAANNQAGLISTLGGNAYLWRWGSPVTSTSLESRDISIAAVSPQGDRIASGHRDGTIRVWDTTGRQIRELRGRGPSSFVNSLAFSPDGGTILSGADNGSQLWRWRAPASRPRTLLGGRAVYDVAFSADGRLVAAADEHGRARLWTVKRLDDPWDLPSPEAVHSVVFSPGSDLIATVSEKIVQLWDPSNGTRVAELSGHGSHIFQASFNSDGTQVITASADATARVWEVQNGGLLLQLRGHTGSVFSANFSPDGKRALTAGADHTARLWDVNSERVLREHARAVYSAAFNPDGTDVVTASADTTARVWHLGHLSPYAPPFWDPPAAVTSAKFSADGKYVVIAAGDRTATVLDSAGRPLSDLPQRRYEVTSAAFNGDGTLVVVGAGPTPTIWDWRNHEVVPRKWPPVSASSVLSTDAIVDAVFGPGRQGNLILTAHANGTARLWNMVTGAVRSLSSPGADILYRARFSPDGTLIGTAGGDGIVDIWDAATGKLLRRLEGLSHSALKGAAFSPDGRLLAAGGTDGMVFVWEVASGKLLAVMHPHAGAVNSAEFSPDGRNLILTASDDGTAKLYPCATCGSLDELLTLAEHRR